MRKNLIQYVRNKLKDRNYEQEADGKCLNKYMNDYTGISLEVFGSFASALSTKESDLDLRINDFYSYKYLNIVKVSRDLTHVPGDVTDDIWRSQGRLEELDHLRHARVPVLKMKDRNTGIEFDVTQGSSQVNNRHIKICRRAQTVYPTIKETILCLKSYLKHRGCN